MIGDFSLKKTHKLSPETKLKKKKKRIQKKKIEIRYLFYLNKHRASPITSPETKTQMYTENPCKHTKETLTSFETHKNSRVTTIGQTNPRIKKIPISIPTPNG